MEMFVIKSWLIIPYVIFVCIAWTAYNIIWRDDVELCTLGSVFGIIWGVLVSFGTFDKGITDLSTAFYAQHIPILLLSFIVTIHYLHWLHKQNKINYEYVIYAIPVLLSLTLFFL